MDIELFVVCDAATDSRGKLNILGTFDTIHARAFPVSWPRCSVALRLRYTVMEEGVHPVAISIKDQEGREIVPALRGEFKLKVPPGRFSSAANLVLNIDGLKFETSGEYQIDLFLDGNKLHSLPLFLMELESSR